jgi:hypothetical protein
MKHAGSKLMKLRSVKAESHEEGEKEAVVFTVG